MGRKRYVDFSSLCAELQDVPFQLRVSLMKHGLLTLDDLASITTQELMDKPSIGPASVYKLQEVLRKNGTHFKT